MFQGTSSDAGKSLLAAALCRILTRRGLKVAPFKAQNMALNACVTPDGGEMGRAQALQALACGLEPDVRMNPVLLKPTSDQGSQVIVLGRPVGVMRVRDYLRFKADAWRAVVRAYAGLSRGRDVMVLEGAGSPAEINLRRHDIVNMRMARHAGAAVLLVADIDRGGAFASLAGTMSLLGRADRARVAGFVLNRFRGDAALLDPALAMLTRRTRRPFLGVVPWIPDLRLPEEDSVAFRLGRTPGLMAAGAKAGESAAPGNGGSCAAPLDVVLVDLPHLSNLSDFDALRCEPGVRLRLAARAEDLGQPHLVILPGTRNSPDDMAFLRRTGLAEAITACARACEASGRGAVIGICGGLQLLGRGIDDPLGLEGGGHTPGLGLLPLVTTLAADKAVRRVSCVTLRPLCAHGFNVTGYEIHHGVTRPVARNVPDPDTPDAPHVADSAAALPVMRDAGGRPLGWGRRAPDGAMRVWGSYVHGLFDADAFRHALLNSLRREWKLGPTPEASFDLGPELDRLADTVEASLDMAAVEALLGL